jgi:hypothetical protein
MENEHAMKPVSATISKRAATERRGAMEITAEEREIDRVLVDSFPASDSPPWTPGVRRQPATESAKLDVGAKSHRR